MSDETLLNEEVQDVAANEDEASTVNDESTEEQADLEENKSEDLEVNEEVPEEETSEESLEENLEEETNEEPLEENLEEETNEEPLEGNLEEEPSEESLEEKLEEEPSEESQEENLEEEPSEETQEESSEEEPSKEQESKADKKASKKKEKTSKTDEKDNKQNNSKSKMSKKARRIRLIILIVTLYLDLLLAWLFFLKGFFKEFLVGIMQGYFLNPLNHYSFVVSIAIIVVFLVINLIALGLAKDVKKIKATQNNDLLNILAETDDIDGRNIMEEEYAVDEAGKVVYRTSRTVESIDMKRVYNDFIRFALSEGIVVDKITAREMFASIASGRLVFVKNDDKELTNDFLRVFAKYFGVEFYLSKVTEETNSLDSLIWVRSGTSNLPSEFAKGLQASRGLPEKVNFAFLEGVNPSTMLKYFKDLFEYCKNPEVPCYVKIGAKNVDGGMRDLPKNLWFILSVDGDDIVPSEIAKYSISLNLNIKRAAEKGEEIKFKEVSYPQLVDAINEAYEDNYISEDMWKKLDEFENYLAKRGDYFIDNRIVREMERFAAIYLLCEGEQVDLIDTLLSKKLLLIALPNTYTYLENDEETIMGMAEKIIGADYISSSQTILKQIKTN